MTVVQNVGCIRWAIDVADDHRMPGRVPHGSVETGGIQQVAAEFGRSTNVTIVGRVSAHTWNAKQVKEPFELGIVGGIEMG